MVLHALGMCPICTYRTGRKVRNVPSSLYRLHDTVSEYATAALRLCAMSRSVASAPRSPPSSLDAPLPVPFASSSGGNAFNTASTDAANAASISSTTTTQLDTLAPLRADRDKAGSRLLSALLVFSAEFPRVDLQEASPALFSVLLELTQTLEMERLLVLGWVDKKQRRETVVGDSTGCVGGGGDRAVGVQEGDGGKGKDEVPEVEFKKHMAQRIEAIKMAMIAPKGWYLDETVQKFEEQGREVVRRMLGAAVRCVGERERVVLGAEGRALWLGGEVEERKGGEGMDGRENGEDEENDENMAESD